MPNSTDNYGSRQKLPRKHPFSCRPSLTLLSRPTSKHPSRSSAESPHPRSCHAIPPRRIRMTRIARRRRARRASRNSPNAKLGRSASVKKNSANTQRCGRGSLAPPHPTAPRNSLHRLAAMVAGSLEARAGVEEGIVETPTPIPQPTSRLRVATLLPSDSCTTLAMPPSQTRRTCRDNKTEGRGLDRERQAWTSLSAHRGDRTAVVEEDSGLPEEVDAGLLHEHLVRRTSNSPEVAGFSVQSRTDELTPKIHGQILSNNMRYGIGTEHRLRVRNSRKGTIRRDSEHSVSDACRTFGCVKITMAKYTKEISP